MSVTDEMLDEAKAAQERGATRCCDNGYSDEDHDCQKQSPEEEKVQYLSKLIKGSLRWRLHWYLLRFIMVLESIVWTLMDLLRAWRMRVSARINDNYQAKK